MVRTAPTGTQTRCTHQARLERQLDGDRRAGEDCADDQDQEGGWAVADVEGGEVEPAGAALRREGGQPGEQGRARRSAGIARGAPPPASAAMAGA